MFAWKNTAWSRKDADEYVQPKLDVHTTGMIAGTKVATANGWAGVETIREGQQVLTFDGGLQTVVAITRHTLVADNRAPDSWPLFVPAGALGNRDDMTILPNQPVMVESDMAEEMTGDPFVVIPSLSLVGFRGIAQTDPTKVTEVVQLHFARDEIVFANIGTLFLCHAKVDLFSDASGFTYDVLPIDTALELVDCLMLDEDARASSLKAQFAVA